MRVCVTGGSGFLGSAVVRALVGSGHDVVALVRDESSADGLADVEQRAVDFADPTALHEAMVGCEGLCHVAGAAGRYYPDADHYARSNVELTRAVVGAARQAGVTRAVYTGTVAAAYGLESPYADSKRRGAEVAREIAGDAMALVVVHPSGMIGPHDRVPTPMGRAIARFAAGRQRVIVGGGSGYIHVDDAAAGHVAALEHGDPERQYVLDHEYWTTPELFAELSRIVGQPPPRVLPVGLADRLAGALEATCRVLRLVPPVTTFTTSYLALPRDRFRDPQPDRVALGLPAYRSIPEALRDAVEWFRAGR